MAKGWNDFDDWGRRPKGPLWPAFVVATVLAFGIGVATGGVVVHNLSSGNAVSITPSPSTAQSNANTTTQESNTLSNSTTGLIPETSGNIITQIYNMAKPSIVTITAVTPDNSQSGPEEDVGTGFFIDEKGDIATNNHVVNGQSKVTITWNGRTYTGSVVGTDALDDLALIHVDVAGATPALTLGSAGSLVPGQLVVAIGNPFQLTASVSSGIVSGLNRSMATQSGRMMSGLVQTDAPLNPGNSGGPLFNSAGQVVGINTAIESPVEGSVGIGFAIPIDRFKEVLPKLSTGSAVSHTWLGISAFDIDPGYQQQFHLPVSQGILVMSVTKNGPAAKAGIRGDTGSANNPKGDGDIITGLNGNAVSDVASLTAGISKFSVGDKVQLDMLRHGKKMSITVTLGAWPGSK